MSAMRPICIAFLVVLAPACGGEDEPTQTQATTGSEEQGATPADAGAPDAGAGEAEPVLDPEARLDAAHDAYEQGLSAFQAGRFEEALSRFQQAHEATADPAILFNIGLTADQLGRRDEALHAYEEFLRQRPDADNRAAVEDRIRELRAAPDDG